MTRKFSDLRRARKPRDEKPRLLLVCEGLNTEPDYFDAIKRHFNNRSVEIRLVKAAGQTMQLARAAVREKQALMKLGAVEGDRVCAIFDEDGKSDFHEAIMFCNERGIIAGYSNPCFELWMIWHFEDYGKLSDQHEVQRHFGGICPEYDPKTRKTANFGKFMDKLNDACDRSEHHVNEREKSDARHGRPSSQLHKVIACIKGFD